MKITFTGFSRALGPRPSLPGDAAEATPSERAGLADPRRGPPVPATESGKSKVHWFVPPSPPLCPRLQ